jgi:hypothetical protein
VVSYKKLAVWKVLLILLVLCRSVDAAELVVFPPLVDAEEWAGTYFKGKKLGFSHSTMQVTADSVTVATRYFMKLYSDGADQVTSFTQKTILSRDLRLQSFTLLQEISGHRQEVEGKIKDGKLVYTVSTQGYDKEKSIPFSSDMSLASTYIFNIYKNGLKVGAKGRIPLFLEPMQIPVALEYEVLRREKMDGGDGFVISQRMGGLESTLWVLEDGTVFKEISNQGFESRRETKETAQELVEGTLSASSFITLTLVKPQHEIVQPYKQKRLLAKFTRLRSPGLLPADHRQNILKTFKEADDSYSVTLQINSEARPPARPLTFPVKPFSDPELLADAPEIQSNHPQIRALSRQLVKDKKDAWEAALSINQWVYKNLEKVLVDTVTALEALRERRGECQSHTNLFVALARSAGIPARVVSGLVYSNEYKGFLYHAWPEVFVGEWRSLDPTFGQDLVDATHIKLGEGEQTGPFQLLEFVGRIGVELIDK